MKKYKFFLIASLITGVMIYFIDSIILSSLISNRSNLEVEHFNKLDTDFNLLQKTADQGDPTAMFILGRNYKDGIKVEKNITKSIEWLVKSAEKDDSRAQELLGSIFLYETPFKNTALALYWYKLSSQKDDPTAQLEIAKIYANGLGVEKDLLLASQWLEKANKHTIPPLSMDGLIIR
jgi:TPR repeat protein